MNEFTKRTIFGALYVAVVITSILFAQPFYFLAVFMLLALGATWEFHHIAGSNKMMKWGGVALTFIGLVALIDYLLVAGGMTHFNIVQFLSVQQSDEPNLQFLIARIIFCISFLLYLSLFVLLIISELVQQKQEPLHQWGNLFISQIWVAVPFAVLIFMEWIDPWALLALFIMIWISDTGAYCVGSLIGKHKMIPKVSPGKSWEGLAGSFIFGLLAAWFLFSDPCNIIPMHNTLSIAKSLILGVIIVISGTLGDLLESLVKRSIGIKDSGHFLPGHGGFLDRFDSILLAAPIYGVIYILMLSL